VCLALKYRIVTELSALPLSLSLSLSSCVQYKKSKSSKKGKSLDDDTNLFDPDSKVDGSPTVVSTRNPSPLRNISPSSVSLAPKDTSSASTVVQSKDELDPLPMPPPLIPASKASDPFDTQSLAAADDNDGWEHSDFFNDNAFGSVPFSQDKAAGGTSSGDDDFGFPTNTKSDSAAGHVDSDAFFDLAVNGADSWGEPSAMLPVDFTPRKSTSAAQPSKDHTDNCDAFSYDASEMSEVTNPTYASATVMHNALVTTRPDPDGDDARRKGEHAKKIGMEQKSMQAMPEPRESAIPLLGGGTGDKSDASIEGKENQQRGGKPYKIDRGENAPVSIASSDTASSTIEKLGVVKSNDNARFDIDQGTMANIPRVAKSRIMAKYAKSGKVRRTNESLGTIHSTPVSINKNEPQSPTRSIGTAASSTSVSRTGKHQEAQISTAKKSSSRPSAEPHLGRKGDNVSASARASEAAVQSLRNPNNTQLQPSSLQQGINPATTSTLAYRRGRKSPMRQLTSATSGNISPTKSIEVRGSPKRSPTDKYGASNRKKKVSPSVVDNPAYYSVRVPWS
jgi:hypothetical protein